MDEKTRPCNGPTSDYTNLDAIDTQDELPSDVLAHLSEYYLLSGDQKLPIEASKYKSNLCRIRNPSGYALINMDGACSVVVSAIDGHAYVMFHDASFYVEDNDGRSPESPAVRNARCSDGDDPG